ncbi:hypothetical protein [Enterobacter hormaechei]|uniref:hypothetical protein n=1 Tax=Enterobacter hormaechei TaxID=158836 RepID=UPI002FD73584
MKKDINPPEIVRTKRQRKKAKRYYLKVHNQTLLVRRKLTRKKVTSQGYISMRNSFICEEFLASNPSGFKAKRKKKVGISIPKNFDIFRNTESVMLSVIEITKKLMMPGLREIEVDHAKVKQTSLGSESLLGLLLTEVISHRRSQRSEKISIKGMLPSSGEYSRTLIDHVGTVKELSDDHFRDAEDSSHDAQVHYYRKDNRYAESTSLKGDNKSLTAEDFVNYLNDCLASHELKLSQSAKNKFKACLGEVFDNAEEHCGRNKPVWFVRGFFHDVIDDRFLELSVFNLGNSFYDNFNRLPETSKVKAIARSYVDRHRDSFDVKSLYSVMSLQGSMSTKKDLDPTRGHGSVTLIETFETMYDEYKALRGNEINNFNAEMNIISGETIIRFDGSYRSKTKQLEGGEETFTVAFNDSQSLKKPPSNKTVYTMKDVKFPGVMINIRIPLKGSTVPLPRSAK